MGITGGKSGHFSAFVGQSRVTLGLCYLGRCKNMTTNLSRDQRVFLLNTARETITRKLRGEPIPRLELAELPPALREPGACFVTLTKERELRGCVGSIEASRPLALDVQERSLSAAFEDPRFPPLQEEELDLIQIEISALTRPEELSFKDPGDLPGLLRPGIDGVILSYDYRRATFLPQVWDKLPEPEHFLGRLCQKMGLPPDTWKKVRLGVQIYQVEEFSEEDLEN